MAALKAEDQADSLSAWLQHLTRRLRLAAGGPPLLLLLAGALGQLLRAVSALSAEQKRYPH
jgi:hypothetical protein